jgi:hypothetical protein
MIIASPIVIDLGDVDEAVIEDLLNSTGDLRDEVEQVMDLVNQRVVQNGGNKILVPIVAVYGEAQPSEASEQVWSDPKTSGRSLRSRRNRRKVSRL